MQKITVESVKLACRIALTQKRLLAQTPYQGYAYSRKLSNGHISVCAIGAALNPKSLATIWENELHGATINDSESKLREIFTWPESETEELIEIQTSHDNWLSAARQNNAFMDIARDHFLRDIGVPVESDNLDSLDTL